MNINRFITQNWFALSLVSLHTLLVGAWAWIELDGAWNDMNPTMFVMAALYIVDYPIHFVLHPLINQFENTGTYLVATLVAGGTFWYAVGWLFTLFARALRRFKPLYRVSLIRS
jgi:hypothetical protein